MRYWYRDHDWWYIGFSYDPALVASVKNSLVRDTIPKTGSGTFRSHLSR